MQTFFYCAPAFGTKLFETYNYCQFGDSQLRFQAVLEQKKKLEAQYGEKFQVLMRKVG